MEAAKTSSSPVEPKLHFLDYWRIIRIRKTVILAVFLLVVLTTTAVTFILPESWLSMVRIAVEKDISDINPFGIAQNNPSYDPFFVQTQFEKIRSRKVLYEVIDELNLNQKWGDRDNNNIPIPLKTSETFDLLYGRIDVRQTRNTSLIEIRVYSKAKAPDDPAKEAADIANKIAQVYKRSRLKLKEEMSKDAIEVLQKELKEQDDKITDNFPEGSLSGTLEPETVRRFEANRIEMETIYKRDAELLAQLKGLKNKGDNELRKAILTANYDPQLGKLLEDLWTTESTLAKLKETYGPSHPEYRSVAAMQADLDTKVNERIEGILSGLEVKVASNRAQVESLSASVNEAKRLDYEKTAKSRPYFLAKRALDNLQKARDAMQIKIWQETVDMTLPKNSIVEITDPAEPGRRPVSPNFPLNIALGIIVGLIVGVGLAFLIEYLDSSVKTIDDVERALQSPVLGVIPQNVGFVFDEGADSLYVEVYRVLRTNILFSRKDEKLNTVAVVSAG